MDYNRIRDFITSLLDDEAAVARKELRKREPKPIDSIVGMEAGRPLSAGRAGLRWPRTAMTEPCIGNGYARAAGRRSRRPSSPKYNLVRDASLTPSWPHSLPGQNPGPLGSRAKRPGRKCFIFFGNTRFPIFSFSLRTGEESVFEWGKIRLAFTDKNSIKRQFVSKKYINLNAIVCANHGIFKKVSVRISLENVENIRKYGNISLAGS